ncbi:GNAT family N-acetyltransferase [Streptomyces sp. ISL-94]|uniref:GNAT family N-acetyltransferase n=1 Tax=Streptomyces sp. ISL-94 TaxID=2819190 RepID=UPI001BE9169D|nr:GNAT family N-acetyltransferase [Streptomyces sp. ISL-94]MBT2478452.1 GNAT family N-acetyltransferase [Streptomyces sp. ISL-94]
MNQSEPQQQSARRPRLRLRTAVPADAENVLAFWKEAAEGTSITDDVDGVTRLVTRDPDALILAADGTLVGSVIAGYDGWRCSLYRLAVLPSRRRQGIAGALLEAAERRFLAAGGRRGDAMVLEENERAQRAWAAAGYHREDHWRRWVKPFV